MTDPTTFNADVTSAGGYVAYTDTKPAYLRARVTNTQIFYEYSALGLDDSLVTLYTENLNSFFTTAPDESGLALDAYDKPIKIFVDWFRRTVP